MPQAAMGGVVMKRALRSALVVCTALTIASPAPAELLKVRSGVGVKGGVDTYLVSVALPSMQIVDPGQDPEAILAGLCGSIIDTYRTELRKLNPDFVWSPVDDGRTFNAPPCFYDTRKPRSFELGANVKLRDFADLHMGAAGKLTLGPILDDNPTLKAAADAQNLTADTAGDLVLENAQQVTVRFETRETLHELKPNVKAAKVIAEIEKRLGAKNGAAVLVEAQSDDAMPIATRLGEERPCASKISRPGWPYDVDGLIKVLDNDQISVAPAKPAVVAVVDSGIADLPDRFPPELFNDPQAKGLNVAMNSNRTAPYETDVYASHGTEMASHILGGPDFIKAYGAAAIAKRIKLVVVGIVEKDGTIPSANLPQAILAAVDQGADIVSMSLVTSDARKLLRNVIYEKDKILVLAAAGNFPYDLNASSKFPASYGGGGGDLKGRVLTSAAYFWGGKLAHWSARGTRGIDVAAPGCSVPSFGMDGQVAPRNGSSSAAAQTAFVAALLRSIAPKRSAEWIKARIVGSVDYYPGLAKDVNGAGVVNPIKAVALRRTVLQRADKALEFVDLAGDLETTDLCAGAPSAKTMVKISWDAATATIRYAYQLSDDQLVIESCTPVDGAVVSFRPMGAAPESEPETVVLKDVIDMVVADSGFSAAAMAQRGIGDEQVRTAQLTPYQRRGGSGLAAVGLRRVGGPSDPVAAQGNDRGERQRTFAGVP